MLVELFTVVAYHANALDKNIINLPTSPPYIGEPVAQIDFVSIEYGSRIDLDLAFGQSFGLAERQHGLGSALQLFRVGLQDQVYYEAGNLLLLVLIQEFPVSTECPMYNDIE